MAPSRSTEPKSRPAVAEASAAGYLHWSRDPAVGLFVIMPLWVLYEVLRMTLTPDQVNLAELWKDEVFGMLPEWMLNVVRLAILVGVLFAARSITRRHIPWLRVGFVIFLEGVVYGLMLGPISEQLTRHVLPPLAVPQGGHTELAANLVGSLGAGIYEELLFRLVLLSVLAWLFFRVAETFSLSKWVGVVAAILVSSVLFALFHYQLANALHPPVFVFRIMAGVLLGFLFVLRGIGVCVYTHAMYDVFLYLTHSDR